jgi:hypothetical protein
VEFALSLEPVVNIAAGFAATSLIQFVGAPGDTVRPIFPALFGLLKRAAVVISSGSRHVVPSVWTDVDTVLTIASRVGCFVLWWGWGLAKLDVSRRRQAQESGQL